MVASHPQKGNRNDSGQNDPRKSSVSDERTTGNAECEPRESFGSSGAKDSH